MEVERQSLAEAVTLAERKYSEEKKRVDELQQQVKVYKSSLESSKQEFIDYKQKATRILQVSMKWLLDVNDFPSGRHFSTPYRSARGFVRVRLGWLTSGAFLYLEVLQKAEMSLVPAAFVSFYLKVLLPQPSSGLHLSP